jgi:hypothetical protein
MTDPTREQMLAVLREQIWSLADDEDDYKFSAEAALYWFANDWHGGQDSNLYSVLSTSPYRPGVSLRDVEEEGWLANQMYEILETEFT